MTIDGGNGALDSLGAINPSKTLGSSVNSEP